MNDVESWIRTFFEGSWLVPGWNARVPLLLEGTPPHEQAMVRERLERLGRRIAPEWAKDNAVRRIDSADIERWGRRLADARKRGTAALGDEIGVIESEVEARLG